MQSLPKNQSGKKKSALIHNIQGEQLQNVGFPPASLASSKYQQTMSGWDGLGVLL